jgi:hypothetical protein
MRFLSLLAVLTAGCKKPDLVGACKDFVAAANACNADHAEAKGTKPIPIDASLCDDDLSDASNDQLQDGVDRYECKADAFASADCTTDDGYTSASDADAVCNGL